jgi:ABC-type polar amino acid transport system ATPase subunit
MKPAISISNVRKNLGGKPVLRGVSFDVSEGKVIALIGSSGSGKTTLLRCMNALIPLDEGDIRIHDFTISKDLSTVDVRALREDVGMVFQQFNLWPHRTVLQNIVDAPMKVRGMMKEEAEQKAHALLNRVGMSEKVNEHPSALSGGQQQRVAIARALAMEPKVLLFDEVTSSLDPELTAEVLKVIRDIAEERKQTIVIVTHEMEFARRIADEVLFLDNGEIVERGSPSTVLDHPKEKRTQQFLNKLTSQ